MIVLVFAVLSMAADPVPSVFEIERSLDFGLEVSVDRDVLQEWVDEGRGRFGPVELPGELDDVILELERYSAFAPPDSVLAVHDSSGPGPSLRKLGETSGLVAFAGTVEGDPESSVYLAFSRTSAFGWIETSEERVHVVHGVPGFHYLVADSEYTSRGLQPSPSCLADEVASLNVGGAAPVPTTPVGGGPGSLFGPMPYYEMKVVLESDFQFFELFDSVEEAEAYALALVGAVSYRYREQVGLILTYPYLGLHTSADDGWDAQDNGGSCVDVLYEFRDAWRDGNAPEYGHLYHFLSGAELGCGVAWVDVICNTTYGFSVSGNMNGNVAFPVEQGPLNWDFIVVAHELGHNVSTYHTHDYCPPLDECSPYFGGCQDEQICTSRGTIMSYCHLCPGGLSNITTYFHPSVVDNLRARVESSCLVPLEGVLTTDLGYSLEGSGGVPDLIVSYADGDPDMLQFDVTAAPASQLGLFVLGFSTSYLPFLGGGTLVPTMDLMFSTLSDSSGEVHLGAAVMDSYPEGFIAYAHVWFADAGGPHGFAATQAIEFELIKP